MGISTHSGLARVLGALATACLCAFIALPGLAQERPECEEGFVAVGDLGITQLEGTIQIGRPDGKGEIEIVLRFMSEPVVTEIDPDGPAVGKLRKGDVIVAVDGKLITTEGAGKAFVNPPVGVPVELRIRRNGREDTVTIVPDWICEDVETAQFPHWVYIYKRIIMGVGPGPKAPEARPVGEAIPVPPRPADPEPPVPGGPGFPHPWMGIGLKCSAEGNWYTKDLRFREPPEVFRLEPGSEAEKAGLKRRDLITHIDGIAMDTLEGTEHFVEVRPGQRIEWTVLRDGRPRAIEMEAKPIPQWEERFKDAAERRVLAEEAMDALRYSGLLGKTAIEVRGSAPVNVSVDYVLGLVTIKTPDTTIRLKTTEQGDDK